MSTPAGPSPGRPPSGRPVSGSPVSGSPVSGSRVSAWPPPGGPSSGWPLSPIEELDWYLENPGEPSLVHLETHVPARLDQAVLARALAAALDADPEARRRLASSSPWRRHPRWEASCAGSAGLRVGTWRDPGELDALRESLTTEPIPLGEHVARLTLAAGPDRDVLFLQVHHAAFDGVSALALLSAIGDSYRSLAARAPVTHPAPLGPAAPAPPLAPALVPPVLPLAPASPVPPAVSAAPAMPVPPAPPVAPPAPAVPVAPPAPVTTMARPAEKKILAGPPHPAVGVPPRSFGFRFPGTVIRVAPSRSGPARAGYGFVRWTVPVPCPGPSCPGPPRVAESGNGERPRPTVNDLLITALILAVHRWNSGHRRRSRGRISVCVPVNIRDPRDRWTGPGNQSRLIRVTASLAGCEHPFALLASVSDQVRAARERPRPGLDGASRRLAPGWAPVGLKRMTVRLSRRLASPLVTDTALVSNLGLVPAPPSFTGLGAPGLRDPGSGTSSSRDPGSGPAPVWFCGPAPMPRGLGLGVLTAAGRLHLTIIYSRALLDAAAAANFAAVYRLALGELAPDPARPDPARPGPARKKPPQPEPEAT